MTDQQREARPMKAFIVVNPEGWMLKHTISFYDAMDAAEKAFPREFNDWKRAQQQGYWVAKVTITEGWEE